MEMEEAKHSSASRASRGWGGREAAELEPCARGRRGPRATGHVEVMPTLPGLTGPGPDSSPPGTAGQAMGRNTHGQQGLHGGRNIRMCFNLQGRILFGPKCGLLQRNRAVLPPSLAAVQNSSPF